MTETTLTIEQMAQKSTDMHVAALCRITQVSPHEYKLGYLAGYREALERAAKAVEIASPSKNRNDLAEFIRLMGMSGETGP